MAQHAARADFPRRVDGPSEAEPEELGRDWIVCRDCRLRPGDRASSPTVLLHPARGAAVLDVLPSDTPEAVDLLRARLAAARFPAIFAGHLPVAHLRLSPRQMRALPSLLDEAFAAQPPLRLPGGDAWVGVAARAVSAEQPVPRLESRHFRAEEAGRARGRRARGILRTTAAVLVCLAALGGVLGSVLKGTLAPISGPSPATAPERAMQDGPRDRSTDAAAPLAPAVPALPPAPPEAAQAVPAAVAPLPDKMPAAPALSWPPVEVPLPPPPPQASPQRAAAPPVAPVPRVQEPASPPSGGRRAPPERSAPRRQQDAAAPPPPAAAAPLSPDGAAERCRRVSALVGSGAPLGDADMRYFNEACIRW